ncbi:MAG: hypothetical protein WC935_06500 [Thermoleophilia bacterium]
MKTKTFLLFSLAIILAFAGCTLSTDMEDAQDKTGSRESKSFEVQMSEPAASRAIGSDANVTAVYIKVFNTTASRSMATLSLVAGNTQGTIMTGTTENGALRMTKDTDNIWKSGSFNATGDGSNFKMMAYAVDIDGKHRYVGFSDVQEGHVQITASTAASGYTLAGWGPAGGYIIYKDGSGLIYEASPTDASAGQTWASSTNTNIGPVGTAIGTGKANTDTIIASYPTSAAGTCRALTTGGYSYASNSALGWFLPSTLEMAEVYTRIGSTSYGFTNVLYWTSTAFDTSPSKFNAYARNPTTSSAAVSTAKSTSLRFRAIRSFPYIP